VDVIILAGGRGGRLTGIAPPYFKPLLPVDGVPLITNCVRVLDRWRGDPIKQVTIVVAPQNALPITQLLKNEDVAYVVQDEPRGPGDSLWAGLQIGKSQRVMVLLADNTVTAMDIQALIRSQRHAIGVKQLPIAASLQFTYWNSEHKMWVEKVQHTNSLEDSIEAWCGPLIINRELATDLYNDLRATNHCDVEIPIGPYLDTIAPNAARVHVSCTDIGHINYWRNENGN
jgi:bifunctional N-acetylglucosamine-1-phosphate-uridyltransferase/glucosamine-1-phosphate-acetyltransferase GlmU-like protein